MSFARRPFSPAPEFLLVAPLLAAVALWALLLDPPRDAAARPPSPLLRPRPDTGAVRMDLNAYRWPIPGQRKITSTFAEFRQTHFHGGIDVGTGKSTGFRVVAMNDGEVARVRVEPTGYGKMLYLRHPDGLTTTYAHLKGFTAKIDALVRAEQKRRGTYRADLRFAPGQLPVRRGDLVAYSGASGTGSEHLHFELRDSSMDFLNPLLCPDVSIPDVTPPDVLAIAVIPVGEGSRVNGSEEPEVIRLRSGGKGTVRLDRPLRVTGRAGFAVNARDRSEGSRSRHGVYRHRVSVDGVPTFEATLDRAPGASGAEQVWLHYDPDLYVEGAGRFERLFTDGPPVLPFVSPWRDSAGIVDAGPAARREFRIECSDYAGNRTTVAGTIVTGPPPHPPSVERAAGAARITVAAGGEPVTLRADAASYGNDSWNSLATLPLPARANDTSIVVPFPSSEPDLVRAVLTAADGERSRPAYSFRNRETGPQGGLRVDLKPQGDHVHVTVRPDGDLTSAPMLAVKEGALVRDLELEAQDHDTWVATFRPSESYAGERLFTARGQVNGRSAERTEQLGLYPMIAGRTGAIRLEDGFRLEYDSLSLFKSVFLQIERREEEGGTAYRISPERTVMRRGVRVTLPVPPGYRRPGLYYAPRSDFALLAAGDSARGGMIAARLGRWLGSVAVLDDTEPPEIWKVGASRAKDRRPLLSFRYRDRLSGVEYDSLKMYLDGVPVIPEVDGEHRYASYRPERPLSAGSHLLRIRLVDRVGNAGEAEHEFRVR